MFRRRVFRRNICQQGSENSLETVEEREFSQAVSRSRAEKMLKELNPPQREAVKTMTGPLLVLAGAGTGKTRVVTYRIARLIAYGIEPERILAVTFTNKAAAEMKERVGALLGKRQKTLPQVSTFHSHCVRVLRRHIKKLGFPEKFAIYDRGDQESVARDVLREIRVPGAVLKPGDLLWMISGWKSSSVRPQQAASLAQTDKEHLGAIAYRRYQEALKNTGAVDFDDLLCFTEDLFDQFPAVKRREAALFDHLLIDEYQDTNGSQYRIVKALARGHRNLCVVGDDDQSIYGWRGAEVEHILKFRKDWPEARVVRLEDNYRSTSEILGLANRLIGYNSNRYEKVLRAARKAGERPQILQFQTEQEEAEETVADIQRRIRPPGIEPRDIAILFRTNEQPRPFETVLRERKVPYILIGGMSFFDRREVRDILAYLKLLAFPTDEVALLRILNTPPRGIGDKTRKFLMSEAVNSGRPIWRVMQDAAVHAELSPSASAGVRELVDLVERFRKRARKTSLAEITRDLISSIRYEDELIRRHPEPEDRESRWSAVEQVVNAVSEYERKKDKPTMQGFLESTALEGRETEDEKDQQLRRNAVVLMTYHAAKGLEFPHVYMVGMEEGLLPHHRSAGETMDDSEERRLCYVGITRAQDRLTFSLSLTRMKWGKPRPSDPSRFLFEITGQADNPQVQSKITAAKKRASGGQRKKKTTKKKKTTRKKTTAKKAPTKKTKRKTKK